MNTRFKFRVWDVKNKKFLSESNFAIFGNGKLIVTLSGYYNHFTNTDQDNYIIQQYIGLTDINGKDIYEGDIVKFDDSEIAEKPTIGTAEVIWIRDLTLVNAPGYGLWFFGEKSGFYGNVMGRVEVIGNIFDNAELLK